MKGKHGDNIYIEALCVCSKIRMPSLSWIRTRPLHLREIELTSPPANNEVDILIGLDFHFLIIAGRTLLGDPGGG